MIDPLPHPRRQKRRRAGLPGRVLALLPLLPLLSMASLAADIHVSPTGSDAADGTRAHPFATPERARDAARQLRRAGASASRPITIWLHGGDYLRTNALELTREDSGTPTAPIVWRSRDAERVRWLGGRPLTGFHPITDPTVLSRLAEPARGPVLEVDLHAMGLTHFGDLRSRGFSRATTPAHSELFFGGRPMSLARWPDEGAWDRIAGFPETAGQGDDHGGKIGALPGGFLYSGDRPRRWRDVGDVWVHGYWAWDWANSYEQVVELDRDRRLVRTAPPHGLYGFRQGQRFQFLNVLEELDQPGEWYLDRSGGRLYFWPPAPGPGASKDPHPETLLSLLEQPFVRLTDVRHVTFQGIVFEAARGNGIEVRGGASNRIVGCRLRNIGNNGVTLDGGTGHGVQHCDIVDTGDGGVTVSGGDRQTLTPGGHFVEDCHFQRQGRWSKCYVPAVLLAGVGHRVSHNHIHDHPHTAILFTGNDHLLEFNDIHHVALETGDVGAIYTGRDYTYRGNRIRHNFIHDTGGVGMGSMGVYMDDCVSGTEVYGNVFHRVHWAMFIGGGRDHRVENNLFVDCDPAVRADGRGLDRSPVWRGMVDGYMRQQWAAVPAGLYRQRYPALAGLDAYYGPPDGPARVGDAFTGIPPEGNVLRRNVVVGKWLDLGWNAQPSMFTVEDNLVLPSGQGLTDPRPPFRLPKDSPAWKLGFRPIPMDQIGIRRSREWSHPGTW